MLPIRCKTCRTANAAKDERCWNCKAKLPANETNPRNPVKHYDPKRWETVSQVETDKWGLPVEFLKENPASSAIPPRRGPSRRLPRRSIDDEETEQIKRSEVSPRFQSPKPPPSPQKRRPQGLHPRGASAQRREESPAVSPAAKGEPAGIALLSPFLGDPFPIPTEKTVLIGRGQNSTLLFPIKAISRRHAEIYFDGCDFILNDLNSTNGTCLNGERITAKAPIIDGDQIAIGPFEILVTSLKPIVDRGALSSNLLEGDTRLDGSAPWSVTADLTHITVSEVVQVLELNCRSGQLVFQLPGKNPGLLVFSEGRISHGEFLEKEPREAVLALLQVSEGQINFLSTEDLSFETTITDATSLLLLEAARRSDERARKASGDSPPN
jgi:pSer/pThr/pTyr-binding forkhead associated (FHA) protein